MIFSNFKTKMMKKIITVCLLFISILISAQTTPGKHSVRNLDVNTKLADFGVALLNNDKIVFASPSEKPSFIRKKMINLF